MAAPVIVELTRGNLVECRHRGVAAVANRDGLLMAHGDVSQPVFPRSAIKALQCLPVLMSGAAERFGLSAREIALCCASHSGTPEHAECATGILSRIGLGDSDLVCGPHLPLGEAAAHAMLRANGEPVRCHNNCSGKHSGMLATAMHLGEAAADYHLPDHPVQQRVHGVLEAVTGVELSDAERGTDGCSVPNWAIPVQNLAQAFARLVSHEGLDAPYQEAGERIVQACWQHPEMMAGLGRLDTVLMQRFAGDVFVKTGAEGVYCGGIRSLGLGFAVKIEDGAKRGAEAAVSAIIGCLLEGAEDLSAATTISNWRGTVVGESRINAEFRDALSGFVN